MKSHTDSFLYYRWFRPQSKKKMTIEMVDEPGQGPFVWPEEPKDYRPWGKEQYKKATKEQEQAQERRAKGPRMWPDDMKSVREQAAEALKKANRRPAR